MAGKIDLHNNGSECKSITSFCVYNLFQDDCAAYSLLKTELACGSHRLIEWGKNDIVCVWKTMWIETKTSQVKIAPVIQVVDEATLNNPTWWYRWYTQFWGNGVFTSLRWFGIKDSSCSSILFLNINVFLIITWKSYTYFLKFTNATLPENVYKATITEKIVFSMIKNNRSFSVSIWLVTHQYFTLTYFFGARG